MTTTVLLEERMKWEDFREMEVNDDRAIYELLDGIVVKRSPPPLFHQSILGNLVAEIKFFLRQKSLGRVYSCPDVYFDDFNAFVPDLVFISNERNFLIEDGDYVRGAPDLLVEILSPGTFRTDRADKKDICERFAVREFWLIDPLNKTFEIYVMHENAYRLHEFLEREGMAHSTVLAGFELDIHTIFA